MNVSVILFILLLIAHSKSNYDHCTEFLVEISFQRDFEFRSDEKQKVIQSLTPVFELNKSLVFSQEILASESGYFLSFDEKNIVWPLLDCFFDVVYNRLNHDMYLSEFLRDFHKTTMSKNYIALVPMIKNVRKIMTTDILAKIPKCVYDLKLNENMKHNTMDIIIDLWKHIFKNLHNLISDQLDREESDAPAEIDKNIELYDKNIKRYTMILCNIFDRLEKVFEISKQSVTRQSKKREQMRKIFGSEL